MNKQRREKGDVCTQNNKQQQQQIKMKAKVVDSETYKEGEASN